MKIWKYENHNLFVKSVQIVFDDLKVQEYQIRILREISVRLPGRKSILDSGAIRGEQMPIVECEFVIFSFSKML